MQGVRAQAGIFAEINTSMGSYTCRLEYAIAPKTCANFIGLATGERPWLDLETGKVRSEPFYNGITYHRVIAGFMNQSGSPNGQGTDGPGYSFVDEFDTNLLHDGFGDLSMANSGPDSNGSQFFTTATQTTWLNFKHSVFGRLTGGSNVVYAINNVATDANDRPLTHVVINSVVIRRVGPAANAFDIHAQGLPDVTQITSSIRRAGTNVVLNFTNQLNVDNRLYSTTNLADWVGAKLGIEVESPLTNLLTLEIVGDLELFRIAQIQYNDALYAPRNVFDRTLTLHFTTGQGVLTLMFDGAGTGAYDLNGAPGTITSYTWVQDPYRGRLQPIFYSGLIPMELHFDFDSPTNGTLTGTAYPSGGNPFGVAGDFTASP
jgi:peptidyl-prolyl cis-trans isomerase A (cyclophilin A)